MVTGQDRKILCTEVKRYGVFLHLFAQLFPEESTMAINAHDYILVIWEVENRIGNGPIKKRVGIVIQGRGSWRTQVYDERNNRKVSKTTMK